MAESLSSTRRALLKFMPGVAVAASFSAAAMACKPDQALKSLKLTDNHAKPFAEKGETVDYNTSDRALLDGRTYVTLTDTRKNLYICCARERDGVWWAEIYGQGIWFGPMHRDFFQARVLGRVTAVYKPIN